MLIKIKIKIEIFGIDSPIRVRQDGYPSQRMKMPSNKNAPQTNGGSQGIFHLRAVGGGVEPPRSN